MTMLWLQTLKNSAQLSFWFFLLKAYVFSLGTEFKKAIPFLLLYIAPITPVHNNLASWNQSLCTLKSHWNNLWHKKADLELVGSENI